MRSGSGVTVNVDHPGFSVPQVGFDEFAGDLTVEVSRTLAQSCAT